jgi:hypothetical protein
VGEPEVCVLDVGLAGVALESQRLVVVSHRRRRLRVTTELSAIFFLSTVWSVRRWARRDRGQYNGYRREGRLL